MSALILATLAFLATHIVASTPLRGLLAGRLGLRAYLGLYSLIALATLGWMISAFGDAPHIMLWQGAGLRHLPLLVMPLAFILLAAGLMGRNPTLVGRERQLASDQPARGILRITRHPMMWGIGLWGIAHLLARGDAASTVFFGGFAVLALVGTRLMDARKRATLGADWARFEAATSNLPFAAILAGRNRLALAEIGWRPLLAGVALTVLALAGHAWLFGVRPY